MKQIVRLASLAIAVATTAVVISCNADTAPDPHAPHQLLPTEGSLLDNGCVQGSDSVVWNFDWSDVPGATQYYLYVQHQGTVFALIDDSTLTQSSFHYSQLSGYTNDLLGWQWWVRAKVDGAFGSWAGPLNFTVEAANTDCP
jgi:hypothetical protein